MKQKLKALIVEDDRGQSLMARQLLQESRDAEFEVMSAPDLKSAWEAFRKFRPHFVLLDITLPDGCGLDLINQMVSELPNVYIVMLTGSAYANDVERARRLGAMDYVLKPFNLGKFTEMVHKCLAYHAKLDVLDDHFGAKPIDLSDMEIEAVPLTLSPVEMLMREWRILFVDDFHANIEHARIHLEKTGCHLDAATSRDSAWSKIVAAPYDLIFMDTVIGTADGYELTKHIRRWEEQEGMRSSFIIALLDNEEEKVNRDWLHAGMNDYLIKPCRLGDMEKKIRKFALLTINAREAKRTAS